MSDEPQKRSGATHPPVNVVSQLQLSKVEGGRLTNELYVRGSGRSIVKGDQHDIRKVHAGQIDLEHFCGGLNLGLESMRRSAEHHHRPGEFENEFLSLEDFSNMLGDLRVKTIRFEMKMRGNGLT